MMEQQAKSIVLLILLNSLVPQTTESEAFIKVNKFSVPPLVAPGEPVRLVCLYELSGETLHAMKLFKDSKEFYRFTPGAQNPEDQRLAFPVPGAIVDLSRSNGREVWLKPVNKRSAGMYKCQVSVEGTFKSVTSERRMEVGASSSSNQNSNNNNNNRLRPDSSSLNRQQQQRHVVASQVEQLQAVQQQQHQQHPHITSSNSATGSGSQLVLVALIVVSTSFCFTAISAHLSRPQLAPI